MPLNSKKNLRVAVAQINAIVGDLDGNTEKIVRYIESARSISADIIVFPELTITGYPPEDLLFKNDFVSKNIERLSQIKAATQGITAIVGFADQKDGDLYNAAAIISGGEIIGVHHKSRLPNYGVFDERRYFESGRNLRVYDLDGVVFGVEICEDIWSADGPHRDQALIGDAQIIFALNASPFHREKWDEREKMLVERASENSCFFVYGNLVGGQDELVFDGHSIFMGPDGRVICRAPSFEEALIFADIELETNAKKHLHPSGTTVEKISVPVSTAEKSSEKYDGIRIINSNEECIEPPGYLEEIYDALKLGIKDYVEKNGFERVVLGFSGGIDSALTAVIAIDALGKEGVVAVVMPSEFSTEETQSDAVEMAKNLGIEYHCISIQEIFGAYKSTLAEIFAESQPDVTEENLQARARGNILMALSNKFGWLVLTTGNKSEIAVGYSTLYGDMAGGFCVLKDVPKTLVYKLSKYRNELGHVILESIIERPPSAELRPNQKDVDSLPPYEVLDPILRAYVEQDKSVVEIVEMGFDERLVRRVARMVDANEYKRRQAPPGIKITPKAFGKDRRMPITNKYRE